MSRVFFTDRDLGTRFPEILRSAGLSVERHRDHFAPDARDEDWLAAIGARGWVALTHDRRIRYIHNGQDHEYYPDYLVRLREDPPFTLIMEVKGRPDPLEQVKAQAAQRWVDAVNAEGSFGRWGYAIVRDPTETAGVIEAWVAEVGR